MTDAVASILIGHQRLVFSTIDDFQTMHPGSEVDREFPRPGIVALEIAVARRDSTAAYLKEQQIAFSELPDGAVSVPRSEANGAILLLREG